MPESGLRAVLLLYGALQTQKLGPLMAGKPSGSAGFLLVALLVGLIITIIHRCWWPFLSGEQSSGGSPTDIIALSRSSCHPTCSSPSSSGNNNNTYYHPPSCQNSLLATYPDFRPVCLPHNMSSSTGSPVVDEAERIARQFEYPTSEVLRGVKAYMDQMQEGLSKEHTTLSQIPTYVTGVPNGTEKV